jgi:hypothetical protein
MYDLTLVHDLFATYVTVDSNAGARDEKFMGYDQLDFLYCEHFIVRHDLIRLHLGEVMARFLASIQIGFLPDIEGRSDAVRPVRVSMNVAAVLP